jgi:hypothetical protein
MRRLSAIMFFAVVSATGCATEEDKQVLDPVVMGMLETTGPTYDDGQQQIYEVHSPVPLELRRPEGDEVPKGQSPPFPRPPFHLASQTRITVRFTLTNLEDKKHTVELLLDPWNEFVRYRPGVIQSEEETQPNLSGWDKFFVLGPKQRIEGIITPDDMVELATDLATAETIQSRPPPADSDFGGPGLYNRAFNLQNRSSQPDPVLAPYMPPVVPGLTGFDLGLRTYEPARVAVELVIDVEDLDGNRVIKAEDRGNIKPMGPPGTILTPPAGGPGM